MNIKGLQPLCTVLLLTWASTGYTDTDAANELRQFYETILQSAPEYLTEEKKHLLEWKIKQLELQQKAWQSQNVATHAPNNNAIKIDSDDAELEENVEYYIDE